MLNDERRDSSNTCSTWHASIIHFMSKEKRRNVCQSSLLSRWNVMIRLSVSVVRPSSSFFSNMIRINKSLVHSHHSFPRDICYHSTSAIDTILFPKSLPMSTCPNWNFMNEICPHRPWKPWVNSWEIVREQHTVFPAIRHCQVIQIRFAIEHLPSCYRKTVFEHIFLLFMEHFAWLVLCEQREMIAAFFVMFFFLIDE